MARENGGQISEEAQRQMTEDLLERLREHHPDAEQKQGWRSMDLPLPKVERPGPEKVPEPFLSPPDLTAIRAVPVSALRDEVRRAISYIAVAHDVSVDDIMSQSRRRTVNRARHEAFALLRSANYSYQKIGRVFQRDHSTVLHGVRMHAERQRGAGHGPQ